MLRRLPFTPPPAGSGAKGGNERGFVMTVLLRAAMGLAATLLLSACLVTPGKFVSTMDIRADRSFTFTYKGEVIASDSGPNGGVTGGGAEEQSFDSQSYGGDDEAAPMTALLWQDDGKAGSEERFDSGSKFDPKKMNEVAAALAKEKGFRSARYVGDGKFEIDYAISGTLTHAFIFPFNIDAQIVLPFIAVEMRGEDRVRVKAPGFANSFDKSQGAGGMGMIDSATAQAMDGSFTLTTDAEIVSQNEEGGAQDVPQGKRIVWTITSSTSEAPAATLRFK
jgi:hypothetical protein